MVFLLLSSTVCKVTVGMVDAELSSELFDVAMVFCRLPDRLAVEDILDVGTNNAEIKEGVAGDAIAAREIRKGLFRRKTDDVIDQRFIKDTDSYKACCRTRKRKRSQMKITQ